MDVKKMTTLIENENKKTQLKGLLLKELRYFCNTIGEKPFRAYQIFHWMYYQLVDDFMLMDNIPKVLRTKLNEIATINALELVEVKSASNGITKKLLLKTIEGGDLIEAVIIPEGERITLCVSTQVGCPLDCKFCATGIMGYKKNLTPGEIFDQYRIAQKLIDSPITNIVYMGMGEPLLNYAGTIKSINIFSEELTRGISAKKITVSTVGIPPKIYKLSESEYKVKLAFSLHSCFDDIRSEIMPINNKYSIEENIIALQHYERIKGHRITFEYCMLEGINDRALDIEALVRISRRVRSKINIIPFNSVAHMNPKGLSAELKPTPMHRIEEFADELRSHNLTVLIRNTQGQEIAAACGQLAVHLPNGTGAKITDPTNEE